MAISLSVNLNKVALLRNSRGGTNPAPLRAGMTCLDSGAYGLTLHWRADNRHTRADDVRALRALCDVPMLPDHLVRGVRPESSPIARPSIGNAAAKKCPRDRTECCLSIDAKAESGHVARRHEPHRKAGGVPAS